MKNTRLWALDDYLVGELVLADDMLYPPGAALIFGATGGLGEAIAVGLASAGCDIAVVWRSSEARAEAVCKSIERLGVRATMHRCDILRDEVDPVVDAVANAHDGRVHTLVWAAGPMVKQVMLADVEADQWGRAIDTEVNGFFRASRAAVHHMRQRGGGSILHVGSAGDLRWPDKDGLSVAPKAANESLVRGIAREEGRNGIRANSILAGVIEAGMFLELRERGVFDEDWTRQVHNHLALKRWGRPEEIGHAAVFLTSTRGGYTTGQQIAVAGGYGL